MVVYKNNDVQIIGNNFFTLNLNFKRIEDNNYFICDQEVLYRNNLKNREFDKEAAQILESGTSDIVNNQGASEDPKFWPMPTPWKTDSSGCFGISFFIESCQDRRGLQHLLAHLKDGRILFRGNVFPSLT